MARAAGSMLPVAFAAALAGAAALVFGGDVVSYDPLYTLLWGDGLIAGDKPDLEAYAAPTLHPLMLAVSALLAPLGLDTAYSLQTPITFLALGWTAVCAFRIAEHLGTVVAGVSAAVLVMTAPALVDRAAVALQDVIFVAVVVHACMDAMLSPERPGRVQALLAVAGLLRPEAWGLAAVWWLLRNRTVPGAAVAALPVAAWAALDLAFTGNPVFSLTNTREDAEALGRATGLGLAPRLLVEQLGSAATPLVLVASLPGMVIAWRRRRVAILPALAIVALTACSYLALGVAKLPLLERYLLLPATLLMIFAAVGFSGWARGDRALRFAAVVGVLASTAVVAIRADDLDALRDRARARSHWVGDLRAVVALPPARNIDCPLFVPSHGHLPTIAYALRRDPDTIRNAESDPLPAKLSLISLSLREQPYVPPGFRLVARSGVALVLARGC